MKSIANKKLTIKIFDMEITITINSDGDGYSFKTPKQWGGRNYYSFCNYLDEAFAEQYPEIEYIIRTA